MREFLKKNFVIVLAFILPVALIAIVALSVYLPSLFLSTNYNFVYSACTDQANNYFYQCDNYLQKRYSVVNNKLIVNDMLDLDNDINKNYTARLFLHDTKKNESREITVAEAQGLNLSGLLTSPDGVAVSGHYNKGSNFFLFFGSNSSYDYYLTKGKSKSKLNLINSHDRYYYRNNFQFIGWILPNKN